MWPRSFRKAIVVGLFIAFSFALLLHENVMAHVSGAVMEKAIGYGIYSCYNLGAFYGQIDASSITTYDDVVRNADASRAFLINGDPSFGGLASVNCRNLFAGEGDFVGLLNGDTGESFYNTAGFSAQKSEYLEKIGYEPVDGSACYAINLKFSNRDTVTDKICTNDGGVGMAFVSSDGGDPYSVISLSQSGGAGGIINVKVGGRGRSGNIDVNPANYAEMEDLLRAIRETVVSLISAKDSDDQYTSGDYICIRGNFLWLEQCVSVLLNNGAFFSSIGNEYSLGNRAAAAKRVMEEKWGTGYDYMGLKFEGTDKQSLYLYYLKDFYGIEIQSAEEARGGGYVLLDNGSSSCYYVLTGGNDTVEVNGLSADGYFNGTPKTAQQLIDELGADVICNIDSIASSTDPTPGSSGADDDYCKDVDLSGQGWLLCPTMENLTDTATGLDKMVENWLTIDSDFYSSDSPTYGVWEAMRNIANVLMIIILLLIIFSQLTGVGIDNYGIKKMLPKLIAMAIVINLSFIICELAVDLSNIFGSGLRDLFASIGQRILAGNNREVSVGSEFIANVVTVIFAGGSIAGAAAGTAITVGAAALAGGPMAVIIIILTLITIVFAILIFFIMLGARMIIVIGCIAIAPIAFSLYILPNTQKLFKKWWDAFKAALIVFPICGAAMGISKLVKSIVLTTEGADMAMLVVALIAPYLVFFMLPTLLKGSIAALGVLGGALTAVGGTMRSGLKSGQSAVMGTDTAKATMQEGRMNFLRRRVGMGENNQLTERGIARANRAKAKGGASLKTYASRLAQVEKDTGIKTEAESSLLGAVARTEIPKTTMGYVDAEGNEHTENFGKDFANGTREAYYARQFLTAAEAGDVNAMNAAVAAAKAGGMKDKYIASMIRQANDKGHIKLDPKTTKRDWLQNLAVKYGNDFLATDYELKDWAMKGGMQGGVVQTTLGDYGSYAAANIKSEDLKPEDVLKLSGDSLAGLIASGKLTSSMAERVMAMNPNISEDKKVMLGAHATHNVNTGTTAQDLKADVDMLMQNQYNAGVLATSGKGAIKSTVASGAVQAWAANTPTDTVIRDISFRNIQDGSERATHDLWVREDTGHTAPNAPPSQPYQGPPRPPQNP